MSVIIKLFHRAMSWQRTARRRASLPLVLGAWHLASLACGDAHTPPTPEANGAPSELAPAPTHLRLRNGTEHDLESLIVEETLDYGALPAGEQSEYLPAEYLYATALIVGVSGDFRVMYVPVDHVGERPLPPGYYTYELHAEPSWSVEDLPDVKWVSIQLIEDGAR
jgi:hypothetical protein